MNEKTVAGLRCGQVLAALSDYLDGELDSTRVSQIEEHLLGCPNCERFGRHFGSMVVSLRRESTSAGSIDSEWVVRLLDQIDRLSGES
jgi:anti-sigma factor RsiW